MRTLTAVLLLLVALSACAYTIPITKEPYSGEDAAEIVFIRLDKITGSACAYYIKVDGEAACVLPERGTHTKFSLNPGTHTFEAVWGCHGSGAPEPMAFNIKPNATHYFRPNNAYWSGKLIVFEISEIEAKNLIASPKYKYVPPQ